MLKKKAPIILLAIVALLLLATYHSSHATTTLSDLYASIANEQPKLKSEPSLVLKGGDQAKEIVKRWEEKKLKGSGWLHLVYKSVSEVDNGVILPDGNMMPNNYLSDGWYFLNDKGKVERDVVTLKDETGRVLQQAAFSNGIEINFTFGDKSEGIQPFDLNLDLGFSHDLSDMETQGASITIRDINSNGKLSKEFKSKGTFEKPVMLSNSPSPVSSVALIATFDSETSATSAEHMFYDNVIGDSDAYAQKQTNAIGDGVTWAAVIITYINYPPASVGIGWNYFWAVEKCDGIQTQDKGGTPRYITAQQTADTLFLTKKTCTGSRVGVTKGTHNAANHLDYWELPGTIP